MPALREETKKRQGKRTDLNIVHEPLQSPNNIFDQMLDPAILVL